MPPPKKKKGGPRTNPYRRLLNRFYEPLILLLALGKTRGEHSPGPQFDGSPQAIRRRFFENLSFVCDHSKGGESTTAIGVEERDDCYNFWVASNQTSNKIVEFLRDICGDLEQSLLWAPTAKMQNERELVIKCITFAKKRIVKETSLMLREIEKCAGFLKLAEQPEDLRLLHWLSSFTGKDMVSLCEQAYELRHAPEMKSLDVRSRPGPGESPDSERASAFACTRHFLGRLGNHVRAPKKLLEDAPALENLFHEYSIYQIPVGKSIPRPGPDDLTTLASMLKRMLPADDQLLPKYEAALANLDQKLQIHDRVMDKYGLESFQPTVHAEVQVLEFFFKNELQFAGGDRFISCSKPACYCCHLYFRAHPLDVVEPASHKNIYHTWSLPFLPLGQEDPNYKHQLQILNKMLVDIRKEALGQIDRQATGQRVHPDSLTGITSVLSAAPAVGPLQMAPLYEQLTRLNIEDDHVRSVIAAVIQ